MREYITVLVLVLLSGCGDSTSSQELTENSNVVVSYETNNSLYNDRNISPLTIDFQTTTAQNNKAAYVTSQCYTKTEDDNGSTYNPCFSCHINSVTPNYVDDSELQGSREFGEYSKVNRFTNLFKDRTDIVAQISDEEIESYVKEDNYIQKGHILLADKLKSLPEWGGYIPDCYFNFDGEGFDKTPQGEYTLWRAFGYYPFLGTFWPTNGSMDDVLIRLPKEFAQDKEGVFNLDIYKLNLAIVESLIKQQDVAIEGVDEKVYGVDLNQNGVLDEAKSIVFQWVKPNYDLTTAKITNFSMSYVGFAKTLLESNEYLIAPGLYPKKTEFLHSVRYLDVDAVTQKVKMAPRMKELRYAKKLYWLTYAELENSTLADIKEKDAFPDRLRTIVGNTEYGASNNLGWVYQGFIEDAKGELRAQNYEETLYCIGCHSGIGAIADSTFVFQRKFDASALQRGWYHWSQKDLVGIAEPKLKDGRYEYELYLKTNGAGDEFRDNQEVMEKFFDENKTLKSDEIAKVHNDISYLLVPSAARAKELNKAYKVIVEEQSYIFGRDAHVKPVTNVYKEIDVDAPNSLQFVINLSK